MVISNEVKDMARVIEFACNSQPHDTCKGDCDLCRAEALYAAGYRKQDKPPAIRLVDKGYEGVMLFNKYSYDSAFIGVTHDQRAIYDYNKMVEWLVETEGFSVLDAMEWIDYNTLRALPYFGDKAPIILYRI